MGTAITDGTIGKFLHAEYLPDAAGTGDWDGIQLPSDAAITSGEFLLAQTMGNAELVLLVGDDGLTTTTGPVTVTVVTSPTSGGTFNDTVFTEVIGADTVYAVGDKLIGYIPDRDQTECYAKMVVTVTTDNLASSSVDGFITGV